MRDINLILRQTRDKLNKAILHQLCQVKKDLHVIVLNPDLIVKLRLKTKEFEDKLILKWIFHKRSTRV